MKHSKALQTLSTLCMLLIVSGCAHVNNSQPSKSKQPTHKTNNTFHRSAVVQNPARFPANNPTSVMATPRPDYRPLPVEVKF